MDTDTGEIIILSDADLTFTETNISFSTEQLRENRQYNVTITASNSHGQTLSPAGLISKK